MRLIGFPERKPLEPALKSYSETCCSLRLVVEKKPSAEPLNTLLPALVTRLIDSRFDAP